MYKCKYFKAHELIPPDIYAKYGERAFFLMDDRVLRLQDAIREEFGPATVNDYHWGGSREWSGLRTPDSPWYSKLSQHSFGRSVDSIRKVITAEEIRDHIKTNPKRWLDAAGVESITLEDGTSWLHTDVRNGKPGINSFTP